MARSVSAGNRPATRVAAAVLLLVAMGGTLWVPFYARSMPKLGDFPFFYWYQLILVPVVAIVCWLCYALLRAKPTSDARPGDGGGLRK
jgi:cytochrome bd-type quinol oxidase subunit 2